MTLRAIFYGSILIGVLMMLGWSWVLGSPPKAAVGSPELKAYSLRSLAYLGGLLFAFIICFVSAAILIRRTREEAATEARESLRKLTDGALEDLRRAREQREAE